MSRADAYCKRGKIYHNASMGLVQYLYSKKIVYNYFYTLMLLHCPVFDESDNYSAINKRNCQVSGQN